MKPFVFLFLFATGTDNAPLHVEYERYNTMAECILEMDLSWAQTVAIAPVMKDAELTGVLCTDVREWEDD